MPEWNPRANDIFVRAVEIDAPADRRLFLEQQCGGDAALQSQVESLLAAGGKIGSFLEKPAVPAPPPDGETAAYRPLTEGPGTVIGPYKLLQHVGEGGFGAVYMAEQEHPVRRKVALKIIKLGMDTREVIARFESERQALAIMEHPNIARVFDAGATESGRPYFVMELVRGVPITEFCDKNRFSAEQRLKLFVSVCNAIQHAHHKGIIHRDIKPSNVMVTLHDGVPVVKVIDFGVAKATAQKLTERTLFTAYGQMIGTPAYMSPEQAEMSGLDIDMRSDIFSLGVLLYELLTGTTPLDSVQLRKAGYAEMQRLIREEEAPRPSTRFSSMGGQATVLATNRGTDAKRLSQLLRSDLDWIVMKSLDKDRTRRYGSPATFAADVERYLTEQPVEARPPSTWYRFRKTARRNKAALTTAAVVAAALVVGLAATTWQAVRATRAERVAAADRDSALDNAEKAQANEDRAQREAARVRAEQDRTRRLLYTSQIRSASEALNENRGFRLTELLEETTPNRDEPDYRGWEWHYLNRLTRAEREYPFSVGPSLEEKLLRGSTLPTALSSDANWCVTARQDGGGTVFDIFDTRSGRKTAQVPVSGQTPAKPGHYFAKFSLDGSHLLTLKTEGSIDVLSARLWSLRTGDELAFSHGPLATMPAAPVLGPDAGWLSWIEGPEGQRRAGPMTITVCRWDRATSAKTKHSLLLGNGPGHPALAPDGRSVYWIPEQNPSPADDPDPKGAAFECWDLVGEKYQPRWESIPAEGRLVNNRNPNAVVSSGGTMAAVFGPKEVSIYRLADRTLSWQTPLPADLRTTGLTETIHLSDDGNKLVFRWPGTFEVVERRRDGIVTRWRDIVREPLPRSRSGQGPPRLGVTMQLTPDGNTLVGIDEDRGTLRVWNVSRDWREATPRPGAIAQSWWAGALPDSLTPLVGNGWAVPGPDGKGLVVTVTTTGRTAEWPVAFRPRFGENGWSAPPKERVTGPVVIRRNDGAEQARIPAPEHCPFDAAGFAFGGRRLITFSNPPAPKALPNAPEVQPGGGAPRPWQEDWALYDAGQSGELKPIRTGIGRLYPIRDTPYLLELPDGDVSPALTRLTTRRFAIRRADTGQVLKEYAAPPGGRVQIDPTSFSPTGDRFVLFSTTGVPSPTYSRQGHVPVKVYMIETATGKELGTADLGEIPPRVVVHFFPDGQRILIQGGDTRIVRTADATTERMLPAPPARFMSGNPNPGSVPFGGQAGVYFSSNSRYIAHSVGESIRVFDTDTGEWVHHLTGVVGTVRWAIFNPECTRLFAASTRGVGPTAVGRIHVWDLSTGRELLTLPLDANSAELEQAKLYLHTGGQRTRVLDGTPIRDPKQP